MLGRLVRTWPSALPLLFASILVHASSSSAHSDHHDWLDVPDGLSSRGQECVAATSLVWEANQWALLLVAPPQRKVLHPSEFLHGSVQGSPGAPRRGF